jgi:hypothetical protein
MTEEAGSEMAALRAELLTLRRVVDQQTSDQRALNTALVTGDKRLDEMRQRFVETMAERDLRLKERHDLEGMAIKAALAANDRRLDAMNEFRGSLNDALIRMTTRKESEDALDALAAKSEAQMNTLGERIDGRMAPVDARLEQLGRPNWVLVLSSFSVVTAIVVAGWAIIGLRISSEVTPFVNVIEAVKSNGTSRDRDLGEISGALVSLTVSGDVTAP